MIDNDFLQWTYTLKPFYTEFAQLLRDVPFRQHLMRYFMDFEVTRAELENLQYSSRDDDDVVSSMMSKAREIAREIVAEARVKDDKDITAWFTRGDVRQAILRIDGRYSKVEPDKVIAEFETAGVLEKARRDMYKFKYCYGTLLKVMSAAHNMEIMPQFDPRPDLDWGDNEVNSPVGGASWRGSNEREQRDFNDVRNYRDAPRRPYSSDDDLDMSDLFFSWPRRLTRAATSIASGTIPSRRSASPRSLRNEPLRFRNEPVRFMIPFHHLLNELRFRCRRWIGTYVQTGMNECRGLRNSGL